ncbi:MAG: hypothetical protein AB1634_13195, partial [Thermodesulfobacteriota bacterium]
MSEYQYYEFLAIDRPLTGTEMAELRARSTRARITPTSFVNEYSWGDLKGDPDDWMARYFDAFCYLANWGTRILKLRLPSRLLAPEVAASFCRGDAVRCRETGGRIIVSFRSEEEGGSWDEEEADLASMVGVRAELARGDLRALYLGWLLQVQAGELADDEAEPAVPAGLGEPSAALASMADFLRIDPDLLAVAAQASPARPAPTTLARQEVAAWVAGLPGPEKDDLLATLILDDDDTVAAVLRQRFLAARSGGRPEAPPRRRTAGELLAAAERYGEERRRQEAEEQAQEEARRQQEAAKARKKYLASQTGREPKLWAKVETLAGSKQPRGYDEAVALLVDLRD